MAETIRTFIAIELDEATQRALASVQAQLKRERGASAVRWVAPANIHITLKFLGDVVAAQLPAVQAAVTQACAQVTPFTLTLGGLGAFPSAQRANVIWVGAQGQIELAAQLAQRMDEACAALGFAREERPFTAHLTLGRVGREASPRDRQLISAMLAQAKVGEVGVVRVERLSVMQSRLQAGGSAYTRLSAVELTSQT